MLDAALGRRVAPPALVTSADTQTEAVEVAFLRHPDAAVILSFPRLGIHLGARILAEIGDDHHRFADARGLCRLLPGDARVRQEVEHH